MLKQYPEYINSFGLFFCKLMETPVLAIEVYFDLPALSFPVITKIERIKNYGTSGYEMERSPRKK